jgi:hypothetical protein
MKKSILQIVSFLFIFALLFSCEKGKDYTVKGRIVEDCAGNIPVANTEFRFMSAPKKGSFRRDGLDKTITTNSNGEFEFTYNSKKLSYSGIYIYGLFESEDYPSYRAPIKSHEDFDLGNFTMQNSFSFKVKLNVVNSFTANDSLFIMGPNFDTLVTIPGPFSNSVYGPFNQAAYKGRFGADQDGIYQNMKVMITSNIVQQASSVKKGYSTDKNIKMCDQSEQLFDFEIK